MDVRIALIAVSIGLQRAGNRSGENRAPTSVPGPPSDAVQTIGGRIRTATSPRSPGRPQRHILL